MNYNDYVIRGILATNQFGITEVCDLESLKTIFLVQEDYDTIENLIREGNIELIKSLPENQARTGQYLDIILFKNQDDKRYIVTIFDSNALEQDPQVIEIYSL